MGFWGGKERRKYARILRTVPCKLKVGNETLAGSTQNISESGVLIEMYSAPDTLDAVVGQVGQFFLLVDGKEMELPGKVHRIDGPIGLRIYPRCTLRRRSDFEALYRG